MALTLVTFVPNTTIKSAEVNSNFNAVNGELFDIDENNFNPGAQLPDSLFETISTPGKINGQAIVAQTIDAVKGQFIWTISGILAAGVNQGFPFRPSADLIVLSTYLEVTNAPTGAALIVDIKKDGNTIYVTKPQIDAAALTGGSGAILVSNPTLLALNNRLTLDISQVGSTLAGTNLVVYLRCKQKIPQ